MTLTAFLPAYGTSRFLRRILKQWKMWSWRVGGGARVTWFLLLGASKMKKSKKTLKLHKRKENNQRGGKEPVSISWELRKKQWFPVKSLEDWTELATANIPVSFTQGKESGHLIQRWFKSSGVLWVHEPCRTHYHSVLLDSSYACRASRRIYRFSLKSSLIFGWIVLKRSRVSTPFPFQNVTMKILINASKLFQYISAKNSHWKWRFCWGRLEMSNAGAVLLSVSPSDCWIPPDKLGWDFSMVTISNRSVY